MAEAELTARSYEQLEVTPGGARVVGQMELFQQTHGFYLTAFTAAMITEGETLATAITHGETVKVTKAAGSAWVAGAWIYWNESGDEFTDVPASDRFCVGKAQRAATSAAVVGFITFQDNMHPIQLGTTAAPIALAAGRVVDIHVTHSEVGNVEPFVLETIMTGVGATGARAKFQVKTNVVLGGWANALKGIMDFQTNGAVSGLGSAVVAELTLPGSSPAGGNYAPLEVELNVPASAGLGTKTSFIHLSAQGTDVSTFQTSGYLMSINGVATQTGGVFEEVTVTAAQVFDAVLKISVDGVNYFIGLCDDKSFT